jgi:4-hydroxy-tetrahydrodipicolinate synthase
MNPNWTGVFPALTTKFTSNEELDITAMEQHCNFQLEAGVHGIVVLGSLGENGSLSWEEKQEIVKAVVRVCHGRVPVIACCAETTTAAAQRFVAAAASHGADGIMLLPPMRYPSDSRETMTYLRAIAERCELPIMLYNNPVAYHIDISPALFAALADEQKFVAIKESSDNIRRVTDIFNLVGERYNIFMGVDDLALEALTLGAVGWVAGLVCAFPTETVALYNLVKAGRMKEALELYRWFMPLLHLDVSTKFVQNIKLAEAMVGVGTEYVRAPRLPLSGSERKHVEHIIARAIETRPRVAAL